jgi:short-subunit dehydrogenase
MLVNLVRIADHLLPSMIERKFGRIISVISSGVIQPIPNLAISNAIRPALIGWAPGFEKTSRVRRNASASTVLTLCNCIACRRTS